MADEATMAHDDFALIYDVLPEPVLQNIGAGLAAIGSDENVYDFLYRTMPGPIKQQLFQVCGVVAQAAYDMHIERFGHNTLPLERFWHDAVPLAQTEHGQGLSEWKTEQMQRILALWAEQERRDSQVIQWVTESL